MAGGMTSFRSFGSLTMETSIGMIISTSFMILQISGSVRRLVTSCPATSFSNERGSFVPAIHSWLGM